MKKEKENIIIYGKNKKTVIASKFGGFIYECSIFLHYKNYYSQINKKYFSSNLFIENIVESFYITKNIEMCSELYSAPEKWLIDNGYRIYIKPVKKSKKKKENVK
jgi:hypothetical protein